MWGSFREGLLGTSKQDSLCALMVYEPAQHNMFLNQNIFNGAKKQFKINGLKPGCVVNTCNPSTWKIEVGRLEVGGHPEVYETPRESWVCSSVAKMLFPNMVSVIAALRSKAGRAEVWKEKWKKEAKKKSGGWSVAYWQESVLYKKP